MNAKPTLHDWKRFLGAGAFVLGLGLIACKGGSSGGGTSTTAPAPAISAYTPASGSVGTVVTVTGSGFTRVAQVRFNGVSASFSLQDAGMLRAMVPSGTATGTLRLQTLDGAGVDVGPFALVPPATPSGLRGLGGADRVTLMWDPQPEASQFRLSWGLAGGPQTNSLTVPAATTGRVVAGLNADTRYAFSLEAMDGSGTASPVAGPVILATRTVAWPISGSATPDWIAHPFSSPFGPRLKASEAFRYDFHRGIDIPTPLDTPLKACVAGVVSLAGSSPNYADGVFQIKFYLDPASANCSNGNCAYINYLHINSVATNPGTGLPWAVGDTVAPGDLVAYSGASASEAAFPHLHFEVRVGSGFQKDCVTPLMLMPGTRGTDNGLTFVSVDRTNPLAPWVKVAVTTTPLDLDGREVTVETWVDGPSGSVCLSRQSYDMVAWNRLYTPTSGDPLVNLDNPDFNGVTVAPEAYSAASSQCRVAYTFKQLIGPTDATHFRVVASVTDAEGRTVAVSKTTFP